MHPRIYAFDYLKSFIILLVVAHHSALAYTTFAYYNFKNYLYSTAPIVDPMRSIYLDFFQEFNDTFFMSLMFFIAGIFSWSSLMRKGWLKYFNERFLRLGIPFIFGVVLITPIAEYLSFIATGNEGSYFYFWFNVYFQNQWVPGPPWFLWVLLLFSVFLILVRYAFPTMLANVSVIVERNADKPLRILFLFSCMAFVVYLISYFIIPRGDYNSWISLAGPLWFQSNRFLLYLLFFFAGVICGLPGLQAMKFLAVNAKLSRNAVLWIIFAISFYCIQWFGVGYAFHREQINLQIVRIFYCLLFVFIATFTSAALIATFNRFFNQYSRAQEFVAQNAYGLYLFHYPYVTAMQYILLNCAYPAWVKFLIVICIAVGASLLTSYLLRLIPGMKKIF